MVLFFASNWHHERQRDFYAKYSQLKEKYKSQPFEIVTILTDRDAKYAREPVDNGSISWPTYWDKAETLVDAWHIRRMPSELILIDHDGIIRHRRTGADDPILHSSIDAMLKEAKQK